jgi:Ca-activated chloride channel family protein
VVDPLRYGASTTVPDTAAADASEIGYLKMRFKLPQSDTSQLIEQPIERSAAVSEISEASADSRWAAAVAAFGQKLRGSNYGDMRWDDIRALAQGARGADEAGYRAEFMQLIDMARTLDPDPFCTAPPENRNCR